MAHIQKSYLDILLMVSPDKLLSIFMAVIASAEICGTAIRALLEMTSFSSSSSCSPI